MRIFDVGNYRHNASCCYNHGLSIVSNGNRENENVTQSKCNESKKYAKDKKENELIISRN